MRRETMDALREQAELRRAGTAELLEQRGSELSDEQRTRAERLAEIEARVASQLTLEAEDAEARKAEPELRGALLDLEARDYIEAVIADRPLEGRAAEVGKELGLRDHQVPFAALLEDEDRIELRADAATALTDAVKGKPRMEVIPRVFKRSDAAWCGVRMPTAPRGYPVYPVLTGGAAGAMAAAGGGVDSEAATFAATMIEPRRATANYQIRVEDQATFPGLEETLRSDLRLALNKLMDDTVVSGSAVEPNTGSIISHAAARIGAAPAAIATLENFDDTFADGIDGLYAYDRTGVRLLIGIETLRYMVTKRHDETSMTYGSLVASAGGMFRATSRVAAPAANVQSSYRIRPEELRAFAPVWEGLELIRDPYTDAKSGQIRITALMLFGFDIVRGGIQTVDFKLA